MPFKFNPFTNNLDIVEDLSAAGDVTGPGSSVDGNIATFNGVTGKVIQDSGIAFPIPETSGGTGITSYTQGDILYADASNSLAKLSAPTFPGYQLIFNGIDVVYADPGSYGYVYDDFTTSELSGTLNWTSNAQNGGSVTMLSAPGRPGILQLQTGGNSNGARRNYLNNIELGNGAVFTKFAAKVPTLSDSDDTFNLQLGLGNGFAATAEHNDGCYFYYTHGTNSGNWVIKTALNGTRTSGNTSTAVDTDWHEFSIWVNAAGTSVAFYIDGVEVNGSPLTTNIPTTGDTIGPSYTIDKDGGAVGTTNRNVQIDYSWTFFERN